MLERCVTSSHKILTLIRRYRSALLGLAATAAIVGNLSIVVRADPIADFYHDKRVFIYIAKGPGGSYDIYGRLIAQFLSRYLPGNPTIVVANKPGAGGLLAANYLYNIAPEDGTALGVLATVATQEAAIGGQAVNYDPSKFNWIGRVTSNTGVFITSRKSNVRTLIDAREHEVTVAGTGTQTTTEIYPRVLNAIWGTKFKVVGGYSGTLEAILAMERGEVAGTLTSWYTIKSTKPELLKKNRINIIAQYTSDGRHPDLPDVPTMIDLAKTKQQQELMTLFTISAKQGLSLVAPPNVPRERVDALRDAFDKMLKDSEFLNLVTTKNIEFDPLPGLALQQLVAGVKTLSPETLALARAILTGACSANCGL